MHRAMSKPSDETCVVCRRSIPHNDTGYVREGKVHCLRCNLLVEGAVPRYLSLSLFSVLGYFFGGIAICMGVVVAFLGVDALPATAVCIAGGMSLLFFAAVLEALRDIAINSWLRDFS